MMEEYIELGRWGKEDGAKRMGSKEGVKHAYYIIIIPLHYRKETILNQR
jgi:hypothetical protein